MNRGPISALTHAVTVGSVPGAVPCAKLPLAEGFALPYLISISLSGHGQAYAGIGKHSIRVTFCGPPKPLFALFPGQPKVPRAPIA